MLSHCHLPLYVCARVLYNRPFRMSVEVVLTCMLSSIGKQDRETNDFGSGLATVTRRSCYSLASPYSSDVACLFSYEFR